MATKKRKAPIKKPLLVALVAALLIIAAAVFAIEQHKKKVTAIPVTTPAASQAKSTGDKGTSAPATAKGDTSSSVSTPTNAPPTSSVTSTPPASPSGSFVSNHHASFTNAAGEESSCITSPGASCYIKFSNGNTIKQLPAQTTDSSGATVWDWDINKAGLTVGTWQVTAIATLNNQTRSTVGATLEVAP